MAAANKPAPAPAPGAFMNTAGYNSGQAKPAAPAAKAAPAPAPGSFMNTAGYNSGHATVAAPLAPGAFMDTAGYNSGHAPVAPTPKYGPLTYQNIRDAAGTAQQQAVIDAYNNQVTGNTASEPAAAVVVATPSTPSPPPQTSTPIKVATPEIILVDQETLPVELMTNLIFESIGGQELLSLSRHDLISGSSLQFQPISNLSDIAIQNNSHNIIPMPDSSNTYFNSFPIKLDTHIVESYGDLDTSHVYLDKANNQLILKITGIKSGEQVEVEILSSITTFNDTIYQRTIL